MPLLTRNASRYFERIVSNGGAETVAFIFEVKTY